MLMSLMRPYIPRQPESRSVGFTLVEVLVVVAIVAVLAAILLPSLQRARSQTRTTQCLSNMRQLAYGWGMYSDDNRDIMMPGRHCYEGASFTDPVNWLDIGNGRKYCPRLFAVLGKYLRTFAFRSPSTTDDRQDYDASPVYQCSAAPTWVDERNYCYGYNHQFLGNNRRKSEFSAFYNFPRNRSRLKVPDSTVVFGDSLGTAAGVAEADRLPYENNGKDVRQLGNHGWVLDPPHLTATSDRGTFKPSPRTAVDPRHLGKANVAFADGHGISSTPFNLGYRILENGSYVDLEAVSDAPSNRLFSGLGKDVPPPDKPTD